ncbi:MAG: DUF1566 domain-containing protein [Rhodospirillales bacterium]|nr:DUF1566 domain-containing protein [Rhodospirillales bacterium]MCB9996084.1 DUF1566 domain-containing protein [Rhodospirillales bacterium]
MTKFSPSPASLPSPFREREGTAPQAWEGEGHRTSRLIRLAALFLLFTIHYTLLPSPAHAACSNPAGVEGEAKYLSDQSMMAYCDNTNWIAMGRKITSCPNIGDVCADGTVYAGLSPDGNIQMYTTPADAGTMAWNNGNSSNRVATGTTDLLTGAANTATIITIDSDSGTGGTQPHIAAQYCADLTSHGHTDWYLPARSELAELYTNNAAIGGFDTVSGYPNSLYWSSSESSADYARRYNFNSGSIGTGFKNTLHSVRCVRKGSPGGSLALGLIGHWKLDETSGTSAVDSSGNGNNGSMQNGLDAGNDSVTGKIDTALDFDGGDDYINAGNDASLNITGSITLASWVKAGSFPASNAYKQFIAKGYDGTNSQFQFGFQNDATTGNVPRLIVGTWDGSYHGILYDYSSTIVTGQWYHITGTFDGATWRLYIDGQLVQSSNDTASIKTSTKSVLIGAHDANGSLKYFDGQLDDVRIYNRPLSASEITQLYCLGAAGKISYDDDRNLMTFCSDEGLHAMDLTPVDPGTANLAGHWKLDETSGTTATDSSSGGNNGTMNGGLNAGNDSAPGAVDTALDFDGSDDYVAVGNDNILNPTSEITLSAWVKRTSFNSRDFVINKGQCSTAPGCQYWLEFSGSNSLIFEVSDGVSDHKLTAADTTFNTNDWFHIVGTYDGSIQKIFVNGVQDSATFSWSSAINTTASELTIGNRSVNHDIPYGGQIDDVRIYNRALSKSEILYLYNQKPGPCPNIGDVCPDGTVYAGELSGTKLYVPPADQSASAKWYLWFSSQVTGATSNTDGASNQSIIVSNFSPLSNYPAFEVCENLSFAGHSDWFLPAISQLTVLYTNRVPIGGFSTDDYWSSTEFDGGAAKYKNFNTGISNTNSKADGGVHPIRCVRTGQPYSCFNPNGVEGQMIYNSTHDTLQYCNGTHWVGIGK